MISLLIPTINRSDYIISYLNYLKENGFQGQVLIGDSSGQEHFCATKDFVKDFNCKFEIKQYSYPDKHYYQCANLMLKDVNYPYCMAIPDDDILVPSTLEKCVAFLEDNTDFSGVGGAAISCNIYSDYYNKISSIYRYDVREIVGKTATERVYDLMNNYSAVSHSLARTEQLKKRFPIHVDNYDVATANELLPCAVLAAQGKVKMLDDLFVVRQIHQRRMSFSKLFDVILQPHWVSSSTNFIEYLARIVSEVDTISYDEAYPLVKAAWCQYYIQFIIHKPELAADGIAKFHARQFHKTPNPKTILHSHEFRNAIKAIPGSKKIINKLRSLRSIFTSSQGEISLPALLNPSSPYNEDFMPVYKAITQSREGLVLER